MYFFLMIPFLVATAFYLYRDLEERKKECERLQKSNAAMDEIAKKQIEVIDNLSKDLAAMEENDKKQIQSVEKLEMGSRPSSVATGHNAMASSPSTSASSSSAMSVAQTADLWLKIDQG